MIHFESVEKDWKKLCGRYIVAFNDRTYSYFDNSINALCDPNAVNFIITVAFESKLSSTDLW